MHLFDLFPNLSLLIMYHLVSVIFCHYTNSMFRFCILFPSSEAFRLDNCWQFCQASCDLCFLGSITNHLPVSLWSAYVWLQTFLTALQTDRCQHSLCVLFLYFGLKSHLPSHVSCPPVHSYHSLPFIVHLKLRSRCNSVIFVSLLSQCYWKLELNLCGM